MNFLCPSCRTPLPRAAPEHVTCSGCGVTVDLTRVDTAPGQARLWPEVDLSGETLSGYALLKLLGSGGMGTVYEARAPDGTLVALKVLSPLLAAEPALRERFRREARALSALSHPGVVKMLGVGEEHSFCWYAMERVTGQDLRERLKAGPLPVTEVLALGKAMLEALEVVHASGFVHRDLKPSNILLSAEGPKLCDFGIARLEGDSTLTESAALLGSLRYMSPEQRWGKSDARSDLYALGVVLHEALALGVPGEKPLPPSTPAFLARAIAKLTEASPVLRPQSAVAAKRLLRPSSLRPVQLAAAAALLAVVAVGSYAALSRVDTNTGLAVVDAGPALAAASGLPELAAAVVDAGPGAAPDAGLTEVAAAPVEPDAGPSVVADAPVDAGNLLAVLRGASSTSPGPKPVKGGLPTKLLSKSPAFDDVLGTLGTGGSKKKSRVTKPPAKFEEPAGGRIIVSGAGAATVSIDGASRGDAPGEFDVGLGGHAVQVVCKVGEKRQGFKVALNGKAPSKTLTYDCPGG